jgi:exodeoxyribonuclease X
MSGPAILFDTETTGRGEVREVIEAAWIRPMRVNDLAGESDRIPSPLSDHDLESFEKRYKPSIPIEFGAMAVHHILPMELEDCEPAGSFALPDGVEYLIGHSIDFDWEAIGSPRVKRICTYAISLHLWPDVDSHSLSALLYRLRGANAFTRELLRGAHSALTDCNLCSLLVQEIIEARDVKTWSELYELSEACRIPLVMPIGDRQGVKGLTLDEAYAADAGFVHWCLNQSWLDPYLRTGLEQAIDKVRKQAEDDVVAVLDPDDEDDEAPF